MTVLMSAMYPFGYEETEELENLATKTEMCEKRILLNVERNFNPAEKACSN